MVDIEVVKEILEYIVQNRITSYYEFKDYSFKNKPEWYTYFTKRSTRLMISEYIKKIRKEEQEKGHEPLTLEESLMKIYPIK